MSDSDGDLRDDLIFCVPGYVKVCWFTAEGKEICFGLPTCDFKEPSIPSELPGHGPWPGHGPFPIITEGHSEVEETPRPVPWVNDLSRIARAWGVAGSLQNAEAAEIVQGALKTAAEAIAAESGTRLNLHFPG